MIYSKSKNTLANPAIRLQSAPRNPTLTMSSAVAAMRVCPRLLTHFTCSLLTTLQPGTLPKTAPVEGVAADAAIVAKKGTWLANVISLRIWTMLRAIIVKRLDIAAVTVLRKPTVGDFLCESFDLTLLTKSTDSKVKCSVCQEYGHTRVRCPQAPADDGQGNDGQAFSNSGPVVSTGVDWQSSGGPSVMTTTSAGGW